MNSHTHEPAVLVLEDGRVFRGLAWGARGRAFGEAVFATGMTGYQETLTDPSYAGQIVIQTAPHIGNTGVNREDAESRRIWVNGFVVRDPARRASNWRSERTLDEELIDQDVVGIRGVDTRALTRHLRDKGAMRSGIFTGEDADRPTSELLDQVGAQPAMTGRALAETVSITAPRVFEPAEYGWDGPVAHEVAAVDLGIKAATPRRLAERGVRVHLLPASCGFEEIAALHPDGVFFSNGPGDPASADAQVEVLRRVLDARIPFFGICFGHQLLGRALGFGTYKLAFGHRGLNQPVMDLTTGRVEITSHNHGFAVDAPVGEPAGAPEARYGRVAVSHVGLNDNVVEGLRALDLPAFSVQYHPESAAGPRDAAYLFDRFIRMMDRAGHGSASEAGDK